MALVTIVGPLKDEKSAIETCAELGNANHSIYSKAINDAEGYEIGREWFVERNTDLIGRVFGYEWAQIQAMQQKSK
jgi:hypothetical protein